jgi:hypothetical protein
MITRAEVEKLGAMHAVEPTMLSLYLAVPPQPAPLSVVAARADELIAAAETAGGVYRPVAEQDRNSVREQLAMCGRTWPGHMVAIFACADAGLLEAFPLPCPLREQAVLGIRPHIRPLLAALQQSPEQYARRPVADEILFAPRDTSVAIGLPACLAAVNACAVQTLIVPGAGLVPGYECGRCGALSTDADSCPDWGTASLPVPDVIEEMVIRALEDGAQISVIRGAHSPVAARLYFPVAAAA